MNVDISVVVCSHNPNPDYFARVLEALKSQTVPLTDWELLLVDNASREPLAERFDLSWHPNARHIYEEQLGVVFARYRGFKESQGAISIIVDDDNILDHDYLRSAFEIAKSHSTIGAWGGQAFPEFVGGQPEEWTRSAWGMLALSQFDRDVWSNLDQPETMPVGAGMCVRREVAQNHIDLLKSDPRRFSLGRRGDLLLSCEDFDLALTAIDMGFGVGKFTQLKLVHIIPVHRLTEDYLLKLVKGIVFSRAIMNYIRSKPEEQLSWRRKVRYFITSLWMSPRDRRFLKVTKQAQALAVKQIRQMKADFNPTNLGEQVYQQ